MKKALLTALAMISSVSLTASAFAEAKVENISVPRLLQEEDLSDYVTLGDYKGIELEAVDTAPGEDELEFEISQRLADTAEQVTDGTVQNGDTAVIDFVGKKDDVAFDGGTAEEYPLEIGSGTFIPGFEDGVIGMAVGETKDIPLTFPENYGSEELAGQDVVFTVTVNRINRPSDLTDEWVQANSDYESVDEYKDSVRTELEAQNAASADEMLAQEAFYQVWVSSEIKDYPEEDLQNAIDWMTEQMVTFAKEGDMTLEEFVESQGMDMEQFEAETEEYAKQRVAQDLIVQSIIDEEEISMDDEEIQKIAEKLVTQYGFEDLVGLIEVYGESEVYATIALYRVEQFIVDNAVIVEPAEEETEETEGDAVVEAIEEIDETQVPEDVTEAEEPAEEETEEPAEEESAEEETEEAAEEEAPAGEPEE